MIIEIIIGVLGIALLVAGYLIPARKEEEESVETFSRDQVQEMVSQEVETVRSRIDGIVDETVQYAIEKAERGMDRLSDEKMIAVSEYSDSVLEQIGKNHEEVVFLYDMLNDKHENLKETVAEATRTANEVDEKVKAAEENLAPIVEKIENTIEAASHIPEAPPAAVAEEPEPAPVRQRSKPVPIVKNETILPVMVPDDNENEDPNDDYLEDEWEDFDDTDDDNEPEGPELSFSSRSPGSRNSNDRILELHKEGKSNMAIAKELGLGIGEVKLVIDLFKGQ
ncbi:hypothetical protein SAMN02910292_02386 [Lachnospiraceae bacterium XBB2008]|nr:hypothetical protein [Lachnospiraceae bacterium]SCY65570.1 hypothetical protein SAMN02910292_02386 [Lachnospiraceae bacterium XBB2008]